MEVLGKKRRLGLNHCGRQRSGRRTERRFAAAVLLLTVLLLWRGLLFPAKLQAKEAFTLHDYHVEMRVHDNNSYEVKESFTADFASGRHGIIRKIPLKTYRGDRVKITDVEANVAKRVYRSGGYLNIRLGDESRQVIGEVDYEISYLFVIGDDKLKDMDELYFNLVGTEWDTTIENVSFNITMPKPFSPDKLNFTYGEKGSTKQAPVDLDLSETGIAGRLLEDLGPFEGLTIALPLPEGYFDGELPRVLNPLDYIEPLFYLFWGAVGAVIFYFVRRRKPYSSAVSFYPPAGLNPADVDFLYRKNVTLRGLAALLLFWADQGMIELRDVSAVNKQGEQVQDMQILPGKAPQRELLPHEAEAYRLLLELINTKGPLLFDTHPEGIMQFFTRTKNAFLKFWKKSEHRVFKPGDRAAKFFLHVAGFVPLAFVLGRSFAETGRNSLFEDVAGGIFLAAVLYFVVVSVMAAYVNQYRRMKRLNKAEKMRTGVMLYVLIVVSVIAVFALRSVWWRIPLLMLAAGISFLFALAAAELRIYTERGKKYMQEAEGFVRFLTATGRKGMGGFDAHYFNYNLTFAYALELEEVWTEHFTEMVRASMAPEQAEAWARYAGSNLNRCYSTVRSFTKTTDRISSSGGSGGSSGGGSSGGGSGGGGGSSW